MTVNNNEDLIFYHVSFRYSIKFKLESGASINSSLVGGVIEGISNRIRRDKGWNFLVI